MYEVGDTVATIQKDFFKKATIPTHRQHHATPTQGSRAAWSHATRSLKNNDCRLISPLVGSSRVQNRHCETLASTGTLSRKPLSKPREARKGQWLCFTCNSEVVKRRCGEGVLSCHLILCQSCPPVHWWNAQIKDTNFICPHGLKPDVNIRTGAVLQRKVLDKSFRTWTTRSQEADGKTGSYHTRLSTTTHDTEPSSRDEFDLFAISPISPSVSRAALSSSLTALTQESSPDNLKTTCRNLANGAESDCITYPTRKLGSNNRPMPQDIVQVDSANDSSDETSSEYHPPTSKKAGHSNTVKLRPKPVSEISPRTTRNRMVVVEIPRNEQRSSSLSTHSTPVKISTVAEAVKARIAKNERERKKADGMEKEKWEREMAEANSTPRNEPVSSSPDSSRKDSNANKCKQAVEYEAAPKRKGITTDGEEEGNKKKKKKRDRGEEVDHQVGKPESTNEVKKKKKTRDRPAHEGLRYSSSA